MQQLQQQVQDAVAEKVAAQQQAGDVLAEKQAANEQLLSAKGEVDNAVKETTTLKKRLATLTVAQAAKSKVCSSHHVLCSFCCIESCIHAIVLTHISSVSHNNYDSRTQTIDYSKTVMSLFLSAISDSCSSEYRLMLSLKCWC